MPDMDLGVLDEVADLQATVPLGSEVAGRNPDLAPKGASGGKRVPADGDEELIARIQLESLALSRDAAGLCWLMRHQVRRLLNHCGAVVQLRQTRPVSRHIIGFDVAPHVVRALQLAAQSVKGGFLLSWVREDPYVIEADRLRAAALGPHLRPLTSGHLVLHEHNDAELVSRAVFVFIGVGSGDPNRFKRVVKTIAPSLHRLILNVHRAPDVLLPELTHAEREICRLLLDGASNKAIARTLKKSEATVRNQLHAIFAKLAVRTRTAAAMKLRSLGPAIVAADQHPKISPLEYLYY